MPHGDFSDIGGLFLIIGGLQHIFIPEFDGKFGPFQGTFSSPSNDLLTALKLCGGFMIVVGCMLVTVRWNPINGKLSGLACLGCAANIAYAVFNGLDGGAFVPRLLYVYAAVMALTGLHVMFLPNPAIKAAEDTKKK